MPDWYGEYDLPERRPEHRPEDFHGMIWLMGLMFAVPIIGIFYPEVYYPWKIEWKLTTQLYQFLSDGGCGLVIALFFATIIGPILYFILLLVLPFYLIALLVALIVVVVGKGTLSIGQQLKKIF